MSGNNILKCGGSTAGIEARIGSNVIEAILVPESLLDGLLGRSWQA